MIAQLSEHGKVQRGWLGVQIQQVTPELAKALGLDKAKGALVAEVQPRQPGAEGRRAAGRRDHRLRRQAGEGAARPAAPRRRTARGYGRRRSRYCATARPRASRSRSPSCRPRRRRSPAPRSNGPAVDDQLGLSLSALTPKVRREFSVPDEIEGVLVTGIRDDGPARETGVGPGDVIVRVGSEAVKTPSEVAKQVKAAKEADRNAVMLLINHQGDQRFVALKLPKA